MTKMNSLFRRFIAGSSASVSAAMMLTMLLLLLMMMNDHDAGVSAYELAPEAVGKITWAVKSGSACGGSTISSLEDGTPYGWKPNSIGFNINKCKTKCVDSASCTAFIWRKSDSSCRWKNSVSAKTMNQHKLGGHDCYSLHEEVVSTTWTVKNSWCNGDIINKLEDGTFNSWKPSTEGYTLDMCKSKCVSSPSCVAFDWNDAIRICYWHSSILDNPQIKEYNCYSYKINEPKELPGGWSCEHLSTLKMNNFNDRGDTSLSVSSTYPYTLANGYPVHLTGWKYTRNYAYGYMRNSAGSPTAVVSGLVPGGIYAFKVYQYASLHAGTNPLSVNGISLGSTTSSTSTEATAEGEATADGQGKITFTFTRQSDHVQLSGLAIGRCQAPPTNAPTPGPTAGPTNAPTYAPTDGPTHAPTNTPTHAPTNAPTANPTFAPTTLSPTQNPTMNPTGVPTTNPSESPSGSFFPSLAPTTPPTKSPAPSASPTAVLSASPTKEPTDVPTNAPTTGPTPGPTAGPTNAPTNAPTNVPTDGPTHVPTNVPTTTPTNAPTVVPTHFPTNAPTNAPLDAPTGKPTNAPTDAQKGCPPDILLLKHDGVTTYPENLIRILSQDETTVTVELLQLFTTPTTTIDYIFYQYNVNAFTNICYEEDNVFGGESIVEITIECTRTSQVAFLELWFADDGSKGVLDEQGDTALIPNCCYPDAVPKGTPVTKYNIKIKCISECQGEIE